MSAVAAEREKHRALRGASSAGACGWKEDVGSAGLCSPCFQLFN